MEEQKYQIALSFIKEVGCITAKRLVAYTGSVQNVFFDKQKNLETIPGIGPKLAQKIIHTKENAIEKAEQELEFIQKHQINTCFYLDKNYPNRLRHINDAPVLLYYKGGVNARQKKTLSIVGTRNMTNNGQILIEKIIKSLAKRHPDLVIISGLAYGVDICAHKNALKNNLSTYGVLAHHLNKIYPSVHEKTANHMCANGALISEFNSTHVFDRHNFVKRNRIVAGMADATLVIESGLKGGSLITADLAHSYNRDVLAIPGRPGDEYSKGCNQLIKNNKAALIDCAEDIEYALGWEYITKESNTQRSLFIDLSDEETIVYNIIIENKLMALDSISLLANLPISKVSPILLSLEFKNLIKCRPGNQYESI